MGTGNYRLEQGASTIAAARLLRDVALRYSAPEHHFHSFPGQGMSALAPGLLDDFPPETMKLVDSYIDRHRPLPRTLWHYTSAEGLYGILTTGMLWATDIRFLNDASEFRYPVSLLDNLLTAATERDQGTPREELWESIRLSFDLGYEGKTYVFALSEVRDDLSQWRGYTPSGNGYSIGFDVPSFGEALTAHNFMILPCTYDGTEQNLFLETLLQEVGEYYAQELVRHGSVSEEYRVRLAGSFYALFLALAPFLKHPAFKDEAEWRFATSIVPPDNPGVDLRVGRTTLVPYYKLTLDHGSPRISEVIVGPTSHAHIAELALQKLTHKSKLRVGDTGKSAVPFQHV